MHMSAGVCMRVPELQGTCSLSDGGCAPLSLFGMTGGHDHLANPENSPHWLPDEEVAKRGAKIKDTCPCIWTNQEMGATS